jgi:hypothetical protein
MRDIKPATRRASIWAASWFWELAEDTLDAELLRVAHRALEHPMGSKIIETADAAAARSTPDPAISAGDSSQESSK